MSLINNNTNKKFKLGNLLTYGLSFSASAFGILLNFVLARFLKAEQYGELQFFVALATTISQFLIIGLNSFMIREAKNKAQNGEVFNKCASVFFVIVIFFSPILFHVLNNYVLLSYSNTYLSIIVLSISFLIGVNTLITSFFQGKGKYYLSIFFDSLLPKGVLLTISIIFIFLGLNNALYNDYLIFYICIYSTVAIPFVFILFRKINFNFTKKEIFSILFFFGVTVTYSLGNNLTKVLQGGLYKNNVALGIISVSISIVGLVRVFTGVLDNLMKPIFSAKKREGDVSALIDCYRFDLRVNSYVSIPLYLFFIIHPTYFLRIFGETYVVYPFILVFISLANAISDITGPNGTLLAMTGNEKWELINGFIYFGFYILGVLIFSFNKIYGLTIALLIAQSGVNLVKFIETRVLYKRHPIDLKTFITLVIIASFDAGVILCMSFLKLSLVLWILIGILVGITCVIANCFVLSLYRRTDFKRLISLKV